MSTPHAVAKTSANVPLLPSAAVPVVDTAGRIAPAWHRFLHALTPNPQAAQAQTLKHSPYAFTAPANGSVIISGGTVSKITLTRGRAVLTIGATGGHFPASLGDVFTITFSGKTLPTVTFLPG